MANTIQIKRGLDIPLKGRALGEEKIDTKTRLFAITPDDFRGYSWKAKVKEGEFVAVGFPLLSAKEDDDICLVAPVSGRVKEIKRGERRKIEYISVERMDTPLVAPVFDTDGDRAGIITTLKRSGLFAMISQRPFDIVPDGEKIPRDIFVTSFDTAPLAPPMIDIPTVREYLESGLRVLARLTDGKVYLGISDKADFTSQSAEVIKFRGPHPAGNVGTQIAAISPVNKGETVWTLDAITASRIGMLFAAGVLSLATTVAVTGPNAVLPKMIKTDIGAYLPTLLEGEIVNKDEKVRVISGNVLTGVRVNPDSGFLRRPYRQITIIDEGDTADEFMGWASMNPRKYSVKRTFPAFLRGLSKPFDFDARIKGGHRAMIMSGEYDKVFPFDIYPEYLIKAVLAKDIEKMEQLGIYEVAPEDFALPEFVDTSKLELQKTIRDGLDYLRKETL